jgi:hypothetical protein
MRLLPFRTEKIEQQQAATDHDGRIRRVESGPLVAADVDQ